MCGTIAGRSGLYKKGYASQLVASIAQYLLPGSCLDPALAPSVMDSNL